MFELNGQLYENEIDFLEAAKREYQIGDQELVIDTLHDYGYDLIDLGLEQ